MPEMVAVRGLMKRKFPAPNNGTLGVNIADMVDKFLSGIQYNAVKDDYQQNYAQINTTIGTVSFVLKERLCLVIVRWNGNFYQMLIDVFCPSMSFSRVPLTLT